MRRTTLRGLENLNKRHQIAAASGRAERISRSPEHGVAARMPVQGVGVLEVVDVNHEEPGGVAGPLAADVLLQQVHQRAPIGEAGERVRERQLLRLALGSHQPSLGEEDHGAQDDVGRTGRDRLSHHAVLHGSGVVEKRQRGDHDRSGDEGCSGRR